VISGLFIRNPTMRLKSTVENISVSGLNIYIDGIKQTAVTTYIGVSKIISLSTPVNLVNGSGAAYATYQNFMATTQLGFEISEIRTTTEMPDDPDAPVVMPPVVVDMPDVPIPTEGVRHSQLVSNNSPYRVFNRSCTGCHNGGGQAPNLTDYNTARAATTMIINRMNSTANPMPPSGILRQNDRDLVQSWVNSGAQQ
jgi:cytochrome c5